MLKIVFIEAIKEISCEEHQNKTWAASVGSVKTCILKNATIINERDVIISSRDESVNGLLIVENTHILYLPVEISEKFPSLLAYCVAGSPIRNIWRENFIGLNKLKDLRLIYNQIEKITSDTFSDLKSLQNLALSKNFSEILPFFNS